jgi:hypothetical protein
MTLEQQILYKAWLYECKHPRRVISAACENYPNLARLYRHALNGRSQRPEATQFVYEGALYAIVWLGMRMWDALAYTARFGGRSGD